jgi:thymidine kinase
MSVDTVRAMGYEQGRVELILGPMYAGKSGELLRRVRRLAVAEKTCLVIKYKMDVRYSDTDMATHDHQFHAALPCERLSEAEEHVGQYDCIAVDEGQFFPDIVGFCDRLASQGKIVIVSALDGNFMREPFGNILLLVPRAENVVKLSAVCMMCKKKEASFSQKISGDLGLTKDVGGKEKYVAACRKCHSQSSS